MPAINPSCIIHRGPYSGSVVGTGTCSANCYPQTRQTTWSTEDDDSNDGVASERSSQCVLGTSHSFQNADDSRPCKMHARARGERAGAPPPRRAASGTRAHAAARRPSVDPAGIVAAHCDLRLTRGRRGAAAASTAAGYVRLRRLGQRPLRLLLMCTCWPGRTAQGNGRPTLNRAAG